MAVAAKAACLRVALSHLKSLFIGDELSVLFRKDGFSAMIGELCATARKDGLAYSHDNYFHCNGNNKISRAKLYLNTMFLFENESAKAALYVPNCPYEIKDKDYYTFNLSYTSNPNIHFPINVYKYLFCKRKTNQNNITICLFIINDCEEIRSNIWKLFLHKYQQIDKKIR
ncbi:MAG: hypothetical protein WBA41_13805 [Rivularia sp. (in: cyanobacteria)]